MIDHDRFLVLAAASLTEPLVPEDAGDLERHLAGCPACRRSLAAMDRDHRRLVGLLEPQSVAPRVRVAVARRAGERPRPSPLSLLAAAALLSLLLVGAAAIAGGLAQRARSIPGHAGTWTTTYCATQSRSRLVDCSRWGDGRTLTLEIDSSDRPHVIFRDSLGTSCSNDPVTQGSPYPDPGGHEGLQLSVEIPSSCGVLPLGVDGHYELYRDPDSDTLWEDPDGDDWGLIWDRRR